MGYAAKQKKVKVGIEGADKIVKELKVCISKLSG